jgi:hypothetical protein
VNHGLTREAVTNDVVSMPEIVRHRAPSDRQAPQSEYVLEDSDARRSSRRGSRRLWIAVTSLLGVGVGLSGLLWMRFGVESTHTAVPVARAPQLEPRRAEVVPASVPPTMSVSAAQPATTAPRATTAPPATTAAQPEAAPNVVRGSPRTHSRHPQTRRAGSSNGADHSHTTGAFHPDQL